MTPETEEPETPPPVTDEAEIEKHYYEQQLGSPL